MGPGSIGRVGRPAPALLGPPTNSLSSSPSPALLSSQSPPPARVHRLICPQGGQKEADTIYGMPDPARDPRSIATGRAATAAMTCGKVSVLTSTPIGCRTSSPPPSATHKGSLSFASADPRVIGATPLDPRLWSGHPGGVQPRPRSCGIGGRGRSVRAGVLCAVRPVRRYGAPGERAPARGATPPPPSRQTADPVATISSRECRIPEGIPAPSGISNIGISDFFYRY